MSTQIKNTLFRFVTMRAPELLEKEAVDKTFVRHPEMEVNTETYKSVFLSQLQESTEGKRTALKEASGNFENLALQRKEQLFEEEIISKELFDFATWLTKNRTKFTIDQLQAKFIENEVILDNVEHNTLINLWDNLFYQIVNSKTSYLRDTILSILVAAFFVKNYQPIKQDINALRKLAQARVIIPKSVFEKEDNSYKETLRKVALSNLPVNTKNLDREIETVVASQKIEILKKATIELKLAEQKFQKENQKAYEIAYKTHQNAVKAAYNTATKIEKTYIEPETNLERNVFEYTNLELPTFEFNEQQLANSTVLETSLSSQTASLVENIMATHNLETFEEINDFITNSIITATDVVFNNSNANQTLISTNGILVPTLGSLSTDSLNAFTISGVGLGFVPVLPLQLLFNTISNIADITATNYTATMNNGTSQSSTSFESAIKNGKLSTKIFTEGLNFNTATSITISGEFVLTNATKIKFSGTVAVLQPTKTLLSAYNLKGNGTFKIELLDDSIGTGNASNVIDYIPSGYGISRLGVADYRKVEQEVCCYVPGEVSHIENIMAREYKERTTRRLRRTEDTTTSSKEQEIEKLTDSTSTDRFEMNQEVSSLLAKDTHLGTFVAAGYNNETAGYSLNAGADFATNTTTEDSNSQAVSHAKEITERALDRVVQKVKEERVSKIIEEFSEENTHGFDNRKGDNHVSGVYRWIDKIYKNKIVNYGKRLMYEFMIPEPASFHALATNKIKGNYDVVLQEPKDPRTAEEDILLKLDDNFDTRYHKWVEDFNVEITPKPAEIIKVGKSFAQNKEGVSTGFTHSEKDTVKIPEGYESQSVNIFLHDAVLFGITNGLGYGGHLLGGGEFSCKGNTSGKVLNKMVKGYRNEFPVVYATFGLHSSAASIELVCQLTTEAKEKWKIETFNAIINAYEEKLASYKEQLAMLKAIQGEKVRTNPGFYRQIENVVLRKNCIDYLISNEGLGKNHLTALDSLTTARVDYNSRALETYAAKVKFFEQAFEWNLMSYYFYPFYWANKANWETLYNINDIDDPTFRAFLQSGMARVILTVRPGFEEAVNWYMATGQVWNGGQVPTMDDELFVSIIEELRNQEGEVEETWESRVPTSLTVIQAGSIGLNVQGLPCNTECADNLLFDSDMNPIVQSDNLIGDSEVNYEGGTPIIPPSDPEPTANA